MVYSNAPKTPKFNCDDCNFKTGNRKDYNRHLLTSKHLKNIEWYKNGIKVSEKPIKNPTKTPFENTHKNICNCGRIYKYNSGLYRHKKTCNYKEIETKKDDPVSNDLILKLVEENSEIRNMLFKQFENMQNQITELIPKIGDTNNTINNKQKFNINIFLNERCKDALTMNEFIDKIKITIDDLLVTKNKGLCEGVSNIFIENMNKLSLHERPMHCTDVKRETVYIKWGIPPHPPEWKKDEENKKLKEAISKVSCAQHKKLVLWEEKHPNWMKNSDEQDEYMHLIKNCTDDLQENKKEEKIIKKLCNKVYINSEN